MLNEIKNKNIINNLYNDRYNDILDRGRYHIVYCKKKIINFLKNVDIDFDRIKYTYIKPYSIPYINNIINQLKSIYNTILLWKSYLL